MTEVTIHGEKFYINGEPTYKGQRFRDMTIEGLLMNSRMIQATFDDFNTETRSRWSYPDTGEWDPERNVVEFMDALPSCNKHGLLAVTVNCQGGSPEGYSKDQPWENNAFTPKGEIRPDYLNRMGRVIEKLD